MCSQGVILADDIIIFMVIGMFAENVLEAEILNHKAFTSVYKFITKNMF